MTTHELIIQEFGSEFANIDWDAEYAQLVKEMPHVYAAIDPDLWRKNYEAFPSQQLFHACEAKFKGFSGPVGSGKSTAFGREAVKKAFENPGCVGLIGAPTYRMLADVTRPALRKALREAGIKHKFWASDNVIEIPAARALILCRTLSDPERLIGTNLAWFGVDELTYCPQDSWERLEARLREPDAKKLSAFAAWTAKGFDWVWQRFISDEKLENYEAIRGKPYENTRLPKGYYDDLRKSYNARFFRQEVLGEYLNIFAGQTYFAFDRIGDGRPSNVKPLTFDPRLPLCWSMDFNVRRMSSVIVQYREFPEPEIRVLDEILLTESHTEATCPEFLDRLETLTDGTDLDTGVVQIRIYGDAAGESRSSKASKTDYEIIREWAREHRHRVDATFCIERSNPSIRSRVNSVNSLLFTNSEEIRLWIDPKCKALIKDLEQVGWAKDGRGSDTGELDKTKPELTHMSDALGYFVWKEFGLRTHGGPVSKTKLRY